MVAIKIKNSSLLKSNGKLKFVITYYIFFFLCSSESFLDDSDMEAEKKIIQSNMMIKKEIEKMRKDAEEGDRQMDMGKDVEKNGKEGKRDKMGREMSNMGEDVIRLSRPKF